MSNGLHSALKTTIVRDFTEGGIHYKQVTLQHSKDRVIETLHACPRSFTTSGIQLTDFLALLGFSRSGCLFHQGECYCREISSSTDTVGMGKAITAAFRLFSDAAQVLQACGLMVRQPEGWGFFFGKPREQRRDSYVSGDGHTAAKIERMKESQDEFFRYVFTWIDVGVGKAGQLTTAQTTCLCPPNSRLPWTFSVDSLGFGNVRNLNSRGAGGGSRHTRRGGTTGSGTNDWLRLPTAISMPMQHTSRKD